MSKTYTFTTLTTSPIQYSTGASVQISKVVIPRIQRAYAQGRTTEKETKIRTGFVKSIFEHLTGDTVMDLHFIYGAVKEKLIGGNTEQHFELLDGQQRFTTLYLLHWYLLNRESDSIDESMKSAIEGALYSLVYETRTTTTEFCQSLAKYRCDLKKVAPSAVIKKAKWYYHRYDKDSSIVGMLVMLDAIHEKYNECNKPELWKSLDKLQFYVLPLVKYEMSEDLYIKMNQRGLQLSLFDNFKAELTGVMKKVPALKNKVILTGGHQVSHQESISIQLDSKWIDLFWKPGRIDYDVHYMRFFSRFFAYRYMLDSGLSPREMQNTDLPINVFYTQSEDKKKRGEYLGFEAYKTALKGHDDYFEKIEKVLDTLHDSNNMLAIHNTLRPIWEPKLQGNFFIDADVPFSQSLLIVFGAICDYIIEFPTFDEKIFRQWMRVVWNVVENTNIDSLSAATGPLRNLHHLLTQVVPATPVTISNFYNALKGAKALTRSNAISEEIEKARRIAADEQWLSEFLDAEKHPYLKGAVGFFYDQDLSLKQFIHNRELVKTMFDKRGIVPEYRERHLLIRAIVSNLKDWNKNSLQERYVTEKSEKDKHLKLLLLGNDDVRKMFVYALGHSFNNTDIKRELNQVITTNRTTSYLGLSNEKLRVAMAHNILSDDIKLYDWMETQSSPVQVRWYKGHIAISIPRVWHDRFFIDSYRDQMALTLMGSHWYYEEDKVNHTSLQDYYKWGHFKGENIRLYAYLKDGILFHVDFIKDHHVIVYLKCRNHQQCIDVQNKVNTIVVNNNMVKTLITTNEKDRIYLDIKSSGNPCFEFDYYLLDSFPMNDIEYIYSKISKLI